jgi:enterochelin esterase-like enzyme
MVASVGALWPAPGTRASGVGVQVTHFPIHGPQGERATAVAVYPLPKRVHGEPLPVVVAFHGRGESRLGPDEGYRAWVDHYGLAEAYDALLGGVLVREAFGGLVREAELRVVNAELRTRAFRGLLVVGVYTPDLLGDAHTRGEVDAYAAWVAERLVPKVQRTFPMASQVARQVGVDGVSLGGMVALEVGLRYPEVFGAVGTMQPAIRGHEQAIADLAARAHAKAPQHLRLLSSEHDPLLPTTRALSEALRARHLDHTLRVTLGGHDYAFNRGPGSIELLRFHDAALRTPTEP